MRHFHKPLPADPSAGGDRSAGYWSFKFGMIKRMQEGEVRSVVAAAAYRARTLLRHGPETFDFTPIAGDLVVQEMLVPDGAPAWARSRQQLWLGVENAEPYADGRLARELVLGVPRTLAPPAAWELVRSFALEELTRLGMAVDLAIHEPLRAGNLGDRHAHLLLTLRELNPWGFGTIRSEWNDGRLHKKWLETWRRRCDQVTVASSQGGNQSEASRP